jgi:hypothetical protein
MEDFCYLGNDPYQVETYDEVDKPLHYNNKGMECIDWMAVPVEHLSGMEAYCIGAALKYIFRFKDKGGYQDLEKAIWYLNKCVSENQPKK